MPLSGLRPRRWLPPSAATARAPPTWTSLPHTPYGHLERPQRLLPTRDQRHLTSFRPLNAPRSWVCSRTTISCSVRGRLLGKPRRLVRTSHSSSACRPQQLVRYSRSFRERVSSIHSSSDSSSAPSRHSANPLAPATCSPPATPGRVGRGAMQGFSPSGSGLTTSTSTASTECACPAELLTQTTSVFYLPVRRLEHHPSLKAP